MLPTKEQLVDHLSRKMTNQDIANIYGVTFQKVIQLIKKYKLNPNKLRRVNHFIVYEHWLGGKVVYVGSGIWYRCRRYTNRRNSEHKELMATGKIHYNIVAEFEEIKSARRHEKELIKKYRAIGQAKFNKHIH
ncbi:hypothetical protein [Halobacillus karajensis]|uniref:GIY-YIG domain-containing protein n=1 Tax=Halobacillus karajensis TaxID=195088 RepID=A0A024P8R0_9BACI|nr:hypothetical protein [Halobacillus karajensis]CDQ21221.1 hypothetical protein BN982_03587 [Halobacillus karajensis]CDQ24717.1 hypothetical protein BN983_03013 [Halobacillus karajensis]CDQ28923.1 hypothetical protein BN981_03241 [Halobacillus karajensis]